MTDKECDVAIIGAGIVGLAVGLQLVRKNPGLKVVILDKEKEVSSRQTGHNSGVTHSGLYYKARFAQGPVLCHRQRGHG